MRGHSLFQTLLFVGVRVYFMHVVHEHGKGLGTQRCSQGVIWLPGNPPGSQKWAGSVTSASAIALRYAVIMASQLAR